MKKWKAKLILTGLGVFHQMFKKQYPTYNSQKTESNDSFSKIRRYSRFSVLNLGDYGCVKQCIYICQSQSEREFH